MESKHFAASITLVAIVCLVTVAATATVTAAQADTQQNPSNNITVRNSPTYQVEILWNRTFEGQLILDAARTGNDSYVLNSVTFGENTSSKLIGISSDGTVEWSNDFRDGIFLWGVSQTDEGYLATGQFENQDGLRWQYAMRGHGRGAVWERQIRNGDAPSSLNDLSFDGQQTADGNYLVAGRARWNGTGGKTWGTLTKLNSGGDTLWSKSYDEIGMGSIRTISQASESNYLIGGFGRSWGGSVVVAKIDRTGTVIWNRSLRHTVSRIERIDNERYLLVGRNSSRGRVTMIDSTGDILWSQSFANTMCTDAITLNDGRIMVVGESINILSSEGKKVWNQTYDSGGFDRLFAVKRTGNHTYLLTGTKSTAEGEASYAVEILLEDHKLFTAPLPGTGADSTPADPDNDGLYEDVNGDGAVTFEDAIALAFANAGDLSQEQIDAFDFDGDGDVDFDDAVELAFSV